MVVRPAHPICVSPVILSTNSPVRQPMPMQIHGVAPTTAVERKWALFNDDPATAVSI